MNHDLPRKGIPPDSARSKNALDDYRWARHAEQRKAFDVFASARQVSLLALPTGQCIIIKP
jgi:hypothetical protein